MARDWTTVRQPSLHRTRRPCTSPLLACVSGNRLELLARLVDDFDVLDTHDWPSQPALYVDPRCTGVLGWTSGDCDGHVAADRSDADSVLAAGSDDCTRTVRPFRDWSQFRRVPATILGLYLADTVGQWAGTASVSMKTYTFASPTTGNQAYANYYNGRSGLPTVSWQAFRVFNEQDVVPFAYADIGGIPESGIPRLADALPSRLGVRRNHPGRTGEEWCELCSGRRCGALEQ